MRVLSSPLPYVVFAQKLDTRERIVEEF